MRIAVVCDSMSAYGGAERVIEQILSLFPQAELFAVLDLVPKNQRDFLHGRLVSTSFLQKLPGIERYYRKLLHFWPMAVEQLDVNNYDLVISSHHSVASGVLTRPGQVHVSYVHSPMRYAWDLQHEYLREAHLDHGLLSFLARRTLHKLRVWDYAAAQRPDAVACNSAFVAERLWKTHRRRAQVIYPPVHFPVSRAALRRRQDRDYYISVGRLVPYKRVDLLVRAFAKMPDRRLKVVGTGPEMKKLSALAPPNVELLGFQPDERVEDLLANAKAFLFAGVEDFGISAVEAQAAGIPVIAFRGGGLTETVVGTEHRDPTGLFFAEQSEAAVVGAIAEFERQPHCFRPDACIDSAARFSRARFGAEFMAFVQDAMADGRNPAAPSKPVWWHRQTVPEVEEAH
jgi:glycosyltransferase involved in cell wall biosynthesis